MDTSEKRYDKAQLVGLELAEALLSRSKLEGLGARDTLIAATEAYAQLLARIPEELADSIAKEALPLHVLRVRYEHQMRREKDAN